MIIALLVAVVPFIILIPFLIGFGSGIIHKRFKSREAKWVLVLVSLIISYVIADSVPMTFNMLSDVIIKLSNPNLLPNQLYSLYYDIPQMIFQLFLIVTFCVFGFMRGRDSKVKTPKKKQDITS